MNRQNRLTAGATFSSDAAEQWKNGLPPPLLFERQRTNRRPVSLAQTLRVRRRQWRWIKWLLKSAGAPARN